ncbi:hypothetical protein PCE1_004266 [Barthelona sp. PCE]
MDSTPRKMGTLAETRASLTSTRQSPNRSKISMLTNKLSSLQGNIDNKKRLKRDNLFERLKTIESDMVNRSTEQQKRFEGARDKIQRFGDILAGEKQSMDEMQTFLLEEVQNLLLEGREHLQNCISRYDTMEHSVLALMETRIEDLKNQLGHENRTRQHNIESIRSTLAIEIPRLNELLSSIRLEREEAEGHVINAMEERLGAIAMAIHEERLARESTEEHLVNMLGEVFMRLQADLRNEKQLRQKTEDEIIDLFEDMCVKLNASAVL